MNIPRSQPRPPVTNTTDPIALLDQAANEAEQDHPTGLSEPSFSQHVSDLSPQLELLSLHGQPSQVRQIRESGHKIVAERAIQLQEKRKRLLNEADKSKPQASRFKTETDPAEIKKKGETQKADKCFVDLMDDQD